MKTKYMVTRIGESRLDKQEISRILSFCFAVLCLATWGSCVAQAQNYLTSSGMPPFAAPEPIDIGFTDTANGSLFGEIALASFPQRANQPVRVKFVYNSSGIWSISCLNTCAWNWNVGTGAWQLVSSGQGLNFGFSNVPCQQATVDEIGTYRYYTYSDGASCTGDGYAADSSGYRVFYTPSTGIWTAYAPDGTYVDGPSWNPPVKDTNGNYLTSGLNDTLARTLVSKSGSSYNVLNSEGGTSRYTITAANISVKTNFGQPNVSEYSGTMLGVVQSITLPDGTAYNFKYDCDSTVSGQAQVCSSPGGQSGYYGLLTQVTLPTGGTVSYGWTTFSDSYANRTRWLNARQSAGGSWAYTPYVISTCSSTQVGCQQGVTVNNPDGSSKVTTFTLNNGAWPVQVQTYNTTGTLLSTVNNTYDFSNACPFSGCHGAAYIRLLTSQTTVAVPGGTSITKQKTYAYDGPHTGNITAVKVWKYYAGTSPTFPSVPDRATYMTYLTTGTNDINRALSVTVCNNSGSDSACPGGGSRISQTLNTYDSYSSCASGLKSVTGVVNHDDTNFGSGYTQRGNPTLVQQWVSGSTYLSKQLCYDTTGQVLQSIDPAGHATTYSYADAFYNDSGSGGIGTNPPGTYTPSQPTNAYVTSVTDAIGTQNYGYYFGSGKTAFSKDYNGETTYFHYLDTMDRQTETDQPIGWSLTAYTSATQVDSYDAIGDLSPSTGCTSCRHVQNIYDSFGRNTSEKLANNPSGTSNLAGAISIDSTYDTKGRTATVSHPYIGTSDPNYVFESYAYDGIDRTIQNIHPDSQAGITAYGPQVLAHAGLSTQQSSASTYGLGYPVLFVDESGNQRQEWFDGFGRVIEVDEQTAPGGTPGTGTVTITGHEQKIINCTGPVGPTQTTSIQTSCPYLYDGGTVYVTVNGYQAFANYGQNSTTATIASALAAQLNGSSSPVYASLSINVITLTARTSGSGTNYPLSTSVEWDSGDFSGPSFQASLSGATLTGGSGGAGLSSSPNYTAYTYNAADQLTQVSQGVQTRTYAYDGLGRATSIATPEAGTVSVYFTTSSGSLCSGDPNQPCRRTDARGITATYTYSTSNRLTGKSYSDGTATVSYTYDQGGAGAHALGRLTYMADGSGSETYSYGPMGRVSQVTKVVGTTSYVTAYQYNAAGEITQVTYPSGRVVQQSYDIVGRLCEVAPQTSSCGSASNPHSTAYVYNAAEQLLSMKYGNNVVGSWTYAPASAKLSSVSYVNSSQACLNGSQTCFSLNYYYQQDSSNCPNAPTANNGQIQCIKDNVDSGRSATYTYDPPGRISTAVTNGSATFAKWGLAWTFDRYDNRWSQTVTAGTGPSNSLSFANPGGAQTNQPDGMCFDAAGNILSKTAKPCPSPTFTYDAENRMTTYMSTGGIYTYDGNGLRVKKVAVGTTTVIIYVNGQDIAEYDNNAPPSSPSREFIYSGGDFLATVSAGKTTYRHNDQLSVRVWTDGTQGSPTYGQVIAQQGSYPYGESWYSGAPDNFVFTTYERDSESGLDYALARYYDSTMGRFCSADPLGGQPDDPQSWNRYPYVRNDPVNLTDPSGQGLLSFLIDFFVEMFLPEIAPAIFGQAAVDATTAADTTDWTVGAATTSLGTQGIVGTLSLTAGATTFSTTGALLGAGLTGGALAQGAATGTPQQPQQQAKKDCPQVPQHSKDASVDANIRATQDVLTKDLAKGQGGATSTWSWFIDHVKTNGPWDYKAQPPGFGAYDDFGNFNYGATGSILTSDETILFQGAAGARYLAKGLVPSLRKYGSPFKGPNYGNDPHKNEMIRQGMKYQQNHCKES